MQVSTIRTFGRWAVAAGLWLLWLVPAVSLAQAAAATPARSPAGHMNIVPDSKLKHTDPMDDLAGVSFTTEQKARVEQIRERYRSRMHDVAVDTRLASEQRGAMLEGTERLERIELYQVLTPEQKAEVRKRALARRQAEQKERERRVQAARAPAQPLQPQVH